MWLKSHNVFEFVDADKNEIDDDGKLFYVPLQVDDNNPGKLSLSGILAKNT